MMHSSRSHLRHHRSNTSGNSSSNISIEVCSQSLCKVVRTECKVQGAHG